MDHATEILKPGVYLEVIDLLIYCHFSNIKLCIYMNTETPLSPAQPASEWLSELFPMQSLPSTPLAQSGETATWNIVCTRADYRPTNKPWELNHWAPCVKTEQRLAQVLKVLQAAEVTAKDVQFASMMQDSDPMDPDHDVISESYMQQVLFVTERCHNLKRLCTRLHTMHGVVPVPVKGDGNCGAWSLIALLKMVEGTSARTLLEKDPLGLSEATASCNEWGRMLSVRHAIYSMWMKVAERPHGEDNEIWCSLFKIMMPHAWGTAEA